MSEPSREVVFQSLFREDLAYWVATDRKIALRILTLVEAIIRDPFQGLGKPEPLRHPVERAWSRRITEGHRIVYVVQGTASDS